MQKSFPALPGEQQGAPQWAWSHSYWVRSAAPAELWALNVCFHRLRDRGKKHCFGEG